MEEEYKPGSLIFSICALLVSILWVRECLKINTLGIEWGGPQLFPLLISIIIVIINIIILIDEIIKFDRFIIKNKQTNKKLFAPEWKELFTVGIMLIFIVIYTFIVRIIGFLFATIMVTLYTALIFKAKPIDAVMVSLIISAGMLLLFKVVLEVPLPEGIFGW